MSLQQTQTYAEWLEDGQRNVLGLIDIVDRAGRGLFIKPDAHPEQRIFCSTHGWTVEMRRQASCGRRVVIDVAPQEESLLYRAVGSNLRLKKDSVRTSTDEGG